MATAGLLGPLTFSIPGLHVAPTLHDLNRSGLAYNELPDDGEQPQVPEDIITGLKRLVLENNVQDKFGFHLVHGHLKVEPGQVMFGQHMSLIPGLWTRPIKADQLDLRNLHGHIFALHPDRGFHPYEYHQGPPPLITANDDAFIAAAQDYIKHKGLTGLIAIEVLGEDTLGKDMKEFVLSTNHGTVMIAAEATNPTESYRTTAWCVGGGTDLKGNESSHEKTIRGTHQVFVDGKASPNVGGGVDAEAPVVDALRKEGIIN